MRIDKRAPFEGLSGRVPKELFGNLTTPCYIIDEAMLIKNGEIMRGVAQRTGCKMLLAQKAFSNYDLYKTLAPYMCGTEASGLFEARLGKEEMPDKEVHVFCGAYSEREFDEILLYADHIVFNSPNQLKKFGKRARKAGKSIGLRINPECSTQQGHEIYDPCAKGSRLGTTREQWNELVTDEMAKMLDGLHFHTLCEQNADDLQKTLKAVEEKFGDILPLMKWLNFGGGHHVTRHDYDIELLEKCIKYAMEKWGVAVYMEPGEAWALNSGYLAATVLDVLKNNETDIAIIDASAACHMPDVLEMPYRPPLYNAADAGELMYTVRIGGATCLAGDVTGDYSFDKPLCEGDLLLFGDMAIYTTCKNNTFNGMPLPPIYVMRENGETELLKAFGYEDFKCRLGG